MPFKPVDTAVVVSIGPLIDDTDFKTVETGIAYNQSGMSVDLFKETATGVTKVDITPTTGGSNDWTHKGNGYYELEITEAQNDTEGTLWVGGECDGVLPFESTRYTVVKANVYDSLVAGTDKLKAHADEITDNLITASAIAANAIGSSQLANEAITATKLAADCITAAKIAENAIGSSELADGAITATKIAANAIGSTQLADGTITEAKLGADCITAAKLAADCITAAKIAENTIGASELATDAVTEIQDGLATLSYQAAIKAKTDQLNFAGTDVKATLDGEGVDATKIDGSTAAATKMKTAAQTMITGEAVAGTLSTTEMTTDLTETTDDHYKGGQLRWTSGTLIDQTTEITAYNGSSKKLTYVAVTEAPQAGDTFIIV